MKNTLFRILNGLTSKISFLGKVPLVGFVYKRLYRLLNPDNLIKIREDGNIIYLDSRDEGVTPKLISHRYEIDEMRVFKSFIKEGMIVVDIGANIGYYSLAAAKLVGNKGLVYAVEPEINNYNLLLKNIEVNNYKNIIPVNKAVSDKDGYCELYIDNYNYGGHSFAKDNILYGETHSKKVETITLDTLLKDKKVDILKIDVQGAEGLIIKGGKNVLNNENIIVFMELWAKGSSNLGISSLELVDLLREYGFNIGVIKEYISYNDDDIIRISEKHNGVNLILRK